ncbi:MAG: glycoside hydrolase family 3 C-terminal domain-containing protein [Micropruina sp.]|uniref:glycoside hydrolase family 3 C-terminal domain-containing protein n=1 Tax=Micropruina sp. TaxID=2737536 RepID=UPI0039E531CC
MTFDVAAVLQQLTLAEKAALTSGSSFWLTRPIERLGVPAIMMCDGPHGLRSQSASGRGLVNEDELTATCFPTASALASSWNPALARQIGVALAQEARARKLSVILGPGINLKRSPLCGRNFEYFSEDPVLAGELAVGMVDGIQSGGDVGASVKHYAANNQETDRQRIDVRVSERALRELYLAGFERVVRASRPWTVMCSYNSVNGTPASEHHWLLDEVLRGEFGFDGLVVSDWGAVYDRVPALRAGTDLEMPPLLPHSPDAVVAAVEAGELDAAVLDARARTVLELVAKGIGVLDREETFDADAHHALARAAAAESVVLLANDDALLPLPATGSVAVIGEFARTPRFQGAGSSEVNPTRVDLPLDALRSRFGNLTFAPGYLLPDGPDADPAELRRQAAAAAAGADVAVVFIGLPDLDESEGFDRVHLDLPADQLAVLAAVARRNPRVVVVLVNGAPVDLRPVLPHARGLVEAWLGGQASGGAIADVLSGAVNPSGRLAETLPLRLQDNPSYLNFPGGDHIVDYGEGIYIGYRAYDKAEQDVAFPFGFGLSYTTFDLTNLAVDISGTAADDSLRAAVSVTVTNTGDRAGAEVVQLYLRDPECAVDRPIRELKGFAKVALEPGESTRVTIDLDARAFAYYSERFGRWVIEAGEFVVEIGRNSRDIVLAETLHIDAPPVTAPLGRLSTLFEWVADPVGRELLTEAIAGGQAPAVILEPAFLRGMGTQPMRSLAAFAGGGVELEALDVLIARWRERTGR